MSLTTPKAVLISEKSIIILKANYVRLRTETLRHTKYAGFVLLGLL
jgi:hypothetical protein